MINRLLVWICPHDHPRMRDKCLAGRAVCICSDLRKDPTEIMRSDKTLNQANALFAEGKLSEAAKVLAARIQAGNGCAQTLHLCGVIMLQVDNLADAEQYFRASLAIAPSHPAPLINLGATLRRANKNLEAIKILEQALKVDAKSAALRHNLASAYHAVGDREKAMKQLAVAVELAPENPKIRLQYAEILRELGRLTESLSQTRAAYKASPRFRGLAGDYYFAARLLADWRGWSDQEAELKQMILEGVPACTPFTFLSVFDDPALQQLNAETWLKKRNELTSLRNMKPYKSDQITLGYFSADYKNHPTMHQLLELFERHDRSKFRIVGLSLGKAAEDDWRSKAKNAVDQFVDLHELSDDAAVKLARELQIDIAIDLTGHTKDNRIGLFARGVAPIQVNYMGYPGTCGSNFHDYIIADRVLIPQEFRQFYNENVAYLPNSYQANCEERELGESISKTEAGLPENAFIYCCFNQVYKVTPEVFGQWCKILASVKNSVLWMWVGNELARENLRKQAIKQGIEGQRIIFADTRPTKDHWARLVHADLFLDTRPYTAHTTASDALRMGVPILTRIGKSFAGRVPASLLTCLNMPELIAETDEDYVRIAIELGNSPKVNDKLKEKLKHNLEVSPLFDSTTITRDIERLYEEMYRRAMAGEPHREIVLE